MLQIRYANTNDRPFLALSGKHGDSNIWDQLENGVGINLRKLNSVKIAEGGKSANIGGGIMTKDLVDVLWEEGKMTSKLLNPSICNRSEMLMCLPSYRRL